MLVSHCMHHASIIPAVKTLETLGELLLEKRARAAEAETGSAGSTSTYCILTINTFLSYLFIIDREYHPTIFENYVAEIR